MLKEMDEMDELEDKSEDQEPQEPELREVSPEELKQILEEHRKWVESEGKEGEMADLSRANLQGADLSAANLQGAEFTWVNLQGADYICCSKDGVLAVLAVLEKYTFNDPKCFSGLCLKGL